MKTHRLFPATAALLLTCLPAPWAHAVALIPAADSPDAPAAIPFSQLGAEADKQGAQAASSITPTATGAHLKALMQDLEAEATPEGLWLTSTADEDAGKPHRFRVRAVGMGREGSADTPVRLENHGGAAAKRDELRTGVSALPSTGPVRASADSALWLRPGLVEEYRVSTDGVRQDFIVMQRPAGAGEELAVDLEVSGARAETAAYGVKLTVTATGRELAYSRLHVTDAAGKELTARLEVVDAGRLRVLVRDAGAAYPVRIDPTFSDADWVALNPSLPGANDTVLAFAVDGSGNLYVGGAFTGIGTVAANYIAKWDGSSWSALGSGVDDYVYALAVIGEDLYAGGNFTNAGGTSASYIAKWNGSAWSGLGTGVDDYVRALAVSGSDLYAGGNFTKAGGTSANRIAKWNGSAWSALGTGMNSTVYALAVSGGDLYAGGWFTTAGGTSANYIAKWNGSAWSALGTGMDNRVRALAVNGSDLYAGGQFTTAGGTSANYIAKWDGSAWSALGTGMNSNVWALAASGSDLYTGGQFTTAGGASASYIAKWDGSVWSALGSGVDGWVTALAVSGSDLCAGGDFSTAGGTSANYLAKWNGSAWSALGSGMNSTVTALAADASGHLFVGGSFITAGSTFTPYIAQANIGTAAPEIAVSGNGVDIVNGDDTPDTADHTDFGGALVGGSPVVRTFTITNTGMAELTLTGTPERVGISGSAAFGITRQPASGTVAAEGGTQTFEITFAPATHGPHSATVSIANDDPDANPFTFAIQGGGLSALEVFASAMTAAGLGGLDAAPDATPHGDGMENLLKYAFNMNLAAPDAAAMPPGGDGGLPSITVRMDGASSVLRFEYVRRKNSGLIYTPMMSTALDGPMSWQELTDVPAVTSIDANWERVVCEEPCNPASTPRLYGRVEVSLP